MPNNFNLVVSWCTLKMNSGLTLWSASGAIRTSFLLIYLIAGSRVIFRG